MHTNAPARPAPAEADYMLRWSNDTAAFGMWVFLVSEFMLFAAMFFGYLTYRFLYQVPFRDGSRHLQLALGGTNTVLLLTSSYILAIAIYLVSGSDGSTHEPTVSAKRFRLLIGGTIVLGTTFLLLKSYEYSLEWHDHLVPWFEFHWSEASSALHAQLFFVFYFLMTSLHAIHMCVGLGCLSYLFYKSSDRSWPFEHQAAVVAIGLYWHFVDLVWVFIFPLLYLNGRAG